ncbi:hypothetical protein [Klebsiella pneumoniae]|uniref:hypothetical protein n=1 Tax=Klebsiella pneumoniae TaxID=573 RepID=UPI00388F3516
MGEISVKTGNNARNGGKNSLNRLIRCVCGKKIGPDPRNFNQRVSLGRNDLLIRTFLSQTHNEIIFEGIETEGQLSYLVANFPDAYVQGYFYSKPMNIEELKKYLDKKA